MSNILKRLLGAITSVEQMEAGTVLASQVERMQTRLRNGVDIKGQQFAPYKEDRPTNQIRPLHKAAKLFDDSTFHSSLTHSGTEYKLSLSGRAGTIAFYQNRNRRFFGFSDMDSDLVKAQFIEHLKEAMRRV